MPYVPNNNISAATLENYTKTGMQCAVSTTCQYVAPRFLSVAKMNTGVLMWLQVSGGERPPYLSLLLLWKFHQHFPRVSAQMLKIIFISTH